MSLRTRHFLRAAAAASCALLSLPAFAGELFRVVESLAERDTQRAAVRLHRIAVEPAALADESISLPFPGQETVTARRDHFERRGADDFTWRGWTPAGDRVVLTWKRGYLVGLIYHGEKTAYEIVTLADGQALAELDQSRFPACAGAVDPAVQPEPPAALETPAQPPAAGIDPANDIDLLITYTPQARTGAGGTAQIEATAQAAVDMANTAFLDSKMIAHFDLVAIAPSAREDSGDMGADLSWLAADPATIALRNEVGADMVSLLVEGGNACGIGFVMRNPGAGFAGSAFQVTARSCAVGNLSFAHEHGHNMGMEHDPANGTTPANASFPWSFGHLVNGSYRTVMSYATACSSGCTRVPHFSNPDVLHAGVPTGIAEQRDNARSGDATAPIVANFRDSSAVALIFRDGFESGAAGNWSLVQP